MRIYIAILMTIVSTSSIMAQEIDRITDTIRIERLGLKGNVKMMKELIYSVKDNYGTVSIDELANDSNLVLKEEYKTNRAYYFDSRHRLIKENEYASPTYIKMSKTISYLGGKITSVNSNWNFSDIKGQAKTLYTYDSKGYLSACKLYNIFGEMASKSIYKHNAKGYITEEKNLGFNGVVNYTNTYYYNFDNHGRLIFWTFEESEFDYKGCNKIEYNNDGLIVHNYIDIGRILDEKIEYNKKKLIAKKLSYDEKGILQFTETYLYNDNDQLLEKKWITNDNDESITKFDYLAKTMIITKRSNDIVTEEKIFKNGLIEQYIKGNDNYSYRYKYDSTGNWIKATEYRNTIPIYIKIRTIQYW